MAVTVNVNHDRVEAKVMGVWKERLPLLANEIMNDTNEYVKRDTGTLIASSLRHSRLEEGLIIWVTPYAKRQYWEIETAYKEKNPKATWRWCEQAKIDCKERWQRQAQRLMEM